jgi:hypothetical protein
VLIFRGYYKGRVGDWGEEIEKKESEGRGKESDGEGETSVDLLGVLNERSIKKKAERVMTIEKDNFRQPIVKQKRQPI